MAHASWLLSEAEHNYNYRLGRVSSIVGKQLFQNVYPWDALHSNHQSFGAESPEGEIYTDWEIIM